MSPVGTFETCCIGQCPLSGATRKSYAKRRETGKEKRVQVSYDEGVAIHIGPESCAVAREGFGEALTGGRIGQPLSRERFLFWVPTPCKWLCVPKTISEFIR